MKTIALLLSLICTSAFAQGASLVRGDSLKRREYQTYSTQAFFVDPTGNNTNACTASGVDACATVTGVLNKLPRFIRNNVTIAAGAGTFVENIDLTQFVFSAGATLTITGAAMPNVTPTTGSSTGTVTTYVGTATGSTVNVITDAAATWTVNDFRFRYLEFTSGPQNGQQFPIVSNTATTITLAGGVNTSFAVPAIGNTFKIVTPATIIAPASGSALAMALDATASTGGPITAITFTRLDFQSVGASATMRMTSWTPSNRVQFSQCRILQTGSGTAATLAGTVVLASVVFNANTGAALGFVSGINSITTGFGVYVSSASTTATMSLQTTGLTAFGYSSSTIENRSATGFAIRTTQGGGLSTSGNVGVNVQALTRLLCASGSSGTGIYAKPTFATTATIINGSPLIGTFDFQQLAIENCATGIDIRGGYRTSASGITITGATTGVSLARGAVLETDTITSAGATNDVVIDGTNYALSFINTLTPTAVTNNITNSEFYIGL